MSRAHECNAGRATGACRALIAGLAVALAAAVVVTAGPAPAVAAPEPQPVPRRWQLDIEPGPLRVAVINLPEVGPRAYLYLTYKVTNNSGEDLLFAPSFELASDSGPVMRSGRDVPLEVTRLLIDRLDNPYLEDQINIIGQLLQGEENAKDGIVIWPARHLQSDTLTVYAAGFSGETATVQPPGLDTTVVLRKTLMLRYAVPGTLLGQRSRPLQLVERQWIMR